MQTTADRVLPREIVVEKTREGVRYRLPRRRQLGLIRLGGLVPIIGGLVFLAIVWNIAGGAFRDVFRRPNLFHALFGLFLLIFVAAALKPISLGMLVLFGRCTVELTHDWLRAVDTAGPFRKARRARRGDIRYFEATGGPRVTASARSFLKPLENMGGLEAKFDTAKPMPVALGYPREWLSALGDELTRQISEGNVVGAQPALQPVKEVVKQLPSQLVAPLAAEEILVQPKGSLARLDITAAGVTLVLPAVGLWRGSKGLMFGAVIWCGFMTLFTGGVVLGMHNSHGGFWPILLFVALFWAIGLAMLLCAINMGRRRAMVIADAGSLRIAQESLFGKKSWLRSLDSIAAVRVDRSGLEVNGRPVLELQVHTTDGQKKGFFSGRDEAELQWIATVLRQRLNVPAISVEAKR